MLQGRKEKAVKRKKWEGGPGRPSTARSGRGALRKGGEGVLGAQKCLVGPVSLSLCTPTRPPGPQERAPVRQETNSKTFQKLISFQMLLLNIPCKPQGGASSGPESCGVPVKGMLSYAPQGRCDPQQPGRPRSLGDAPPQ